MEALDEGIQTAPSPHKMLKSGAYRDRGSRNERGILSRRAVAICENELTNALSSIEIYFIQERIKDDSLLKVKAAIREQKEKAKEQTTTTSFFSSKEA